jgi:hypothetical protein
VKEYDIFLPLRYNDGKPIEADKFQALQKELLDRFEGLTFFPQANQGFWKLGKRHLPRRNRNLSSPRF